MVDGTELEMLDTNKTTEGSEWMWRNDGSYEGCHERERWKESKSEVFWILHVDMDMGGDSVV